MSNNKRLLKKLLYTAVALSVALNLLFAVSIALDINVRKRLIKLKNSIIRMTKVVFEESMVSISRMRMKITIPPDMTHLRVWKTLSDSHPQTGPPAMAPTFIKRITCPAFMILHGA